MMKFRVKESKLFTERWHLVEDIEPTTSEPIWFVDKCNELHVGIYNDDVHAVAMADGLGIKLEDVIQWMYVGLNKEYTKYPEDGATVAVEIKELNTLALGMYTDKYVDSNGDSVKAVILEPCYMFEGEEGDVAVDWADILSWYPTPEIEELRPLHKEEICPECSEEEITEELPAEESVEEVVEEPLEAEVSSELAKLANVEEEPKKDPLTEATTASDSAKPEVARKIQDPTSEPTGVSSTDIEKLKDGKPIQEKNRKHVVPKRLSNTFYELVEADETDYEALRKNLKDVLEFAKKVVPEDDWYEDSLLEDLDFADIDNDEDANYYISEVYDVLDGYDIWMEPFIESKKMKESASFKDFLRDKFFDVMANMMFENFPEMSSEELIDCIEYFKKHFIVDGELNTPPADKV